MVRAFLHRCILRFDAQLQRRPLGTQMVVGGLLTYFGDILAQQLLEKRGWDNHDWIRSFRMGCFSVFVWTGVGYKWFTTAEIWFPGRSMKAMLQKLSIDQLLIVPTMTLLFFTMNEYLQGHGWQGVRDRVEADYKTVVKLNWSIWTPAQFINFYYVPVLYRTIFTRIISFFWNIALSFLAHINHEEDNHAEKIE